MHGYGVTLHIEQISQESLHLEEGSLFPALHRMTQAGWLRPEWGASENNRRALLLDHTRRSEAVDG